MDNNGIIEATNETIRLMIQDELNQLIPQYLSAAVDDIAAIKELLKLTATSSEVAALQTRLDEQGKTVVEYGKTINQNTDDIAADRKRMDISDSRFNAFTDEIKRGVGEISANVSSAVEQMLEMNRQAFSHFQSLDKRVQVAEGNIYQVAADIGDVRERLVSQIGSIHGFIHGDKTRPPITTKFLSIETNIATTNTKVDELLADFKARQARNKFYWSLVTSRPGAAVMGGITAGVITVFSNIDAIGFVNAFLNALSGK